MKDGDDGNNGDNQDEFNFEEGRYRAEEGMTRAERTVLGRIWSAKATSEFDTWPSGYVFTPDDMVRKVGLPGTPGNKSVGSWFGSMSKKKKIICVDPRVRSERVDRHAGVQQGWMKV